jgi:hypothetical protein
MAGEDDVMGGAEALTGEVGAPTGISSREEALNSGRAGGVLVGGEGSGVELVRVPVGGRGAGKGRGRRAEEEAMTKMADATEVVNGEGKELDALGVKGGDNVKAGHVAAATKLHLRLLVVPAMSGNHGRRGTWR